MRTAQQTARGYTLFSSTTRYRYKDFEAFLSVENLTNTDWREAQFYFTSRLAGERRPGRERHPLHAGQPPLLPRRHRLALLATAHRLRSENCVRMPSA